MDSLVHSDAKGVSVPGGDVSSPAAYDRDRWAQRRPGEIRGEQAAEVHAQHLAVERPGITTLARARLKLPPEWQAVIWSMEGDYPDYWGMSVEGGICPPKTRGKHKGGPNWKAATMKRKFVATDADIKAHVAQWERRTGKCERCLGTGWRSIGWGCDIGHRYAPCARCSATGRISTANSVGTKGEARSEPNPLDMAGVVERLTEVATRDTAVAVIVRSADLRALLSAFKARGEALEPFAKAADDWSPESNGGHVFGDDVSVSHETALTLGHLRRARTALTQTQGDDHE